MTRATIALVTLAVLGASARADGIIYKRGGKLQVWGMPEKVGAGQNQVEVTPENAQLFADLSTGLIESEGYDSVTAKKTASAKSETFARSEVVSVFYSAEPTGLVEGLAKMDAGQYLQAISDFRDVVQDGEERDTFRQQAAFLIGICYYSGGRRADCIKHYQNWKAVNSRYTPEVFSSLGELLTEDRKFPEARAQYDQIPKLPGIPDEWKYKARLGAVRVDIAERKFDDAERTAQAIGRETQSRTDLTDATALAQVLVADAIWKSGKTERFGEMVPVLARTEALEGMSVKTRGFLYVTQGNLLYAQGKPEEARFPYMRAALMCADSGYEGPAYLNAGQCLLDMSGRETKDQARSDMLFLNGMKLLATAAGTYKQADAGKRYRDPANKARFDALQAKESGGAGGTDAVEPGK
jgi:tetratricopeptide (TPR) repeat protein